MKQNLKHKASCNSTMWTTVYIWFKYYRATARHFEISILDEFSLSELYTLEPCSVGRKCSSKNFISVCLLWKYFEYATSRLTAVSLVLFLFVLLSFKTEFLGVTALVVPELTSKTRVASNYLPLPPKWDARLPGKWRWFVTLDVFCSQFWKKKILAI